MMIRAALLALAIPAAFPFSALAQSPDTPPPTSAFARRPEVYMPSMSPDGTHLLVTRRMQIGGTDVPVMHVYRLSDMAVRSQVRLPAFYEPLSYSWASNNRILVVPGRVYGSLEAPQDAGELLAMNLDGGQQDYLYGYNRHRYSRRAGTREDSWGELEGISEARDGLVFISDHSFEEHRERTMLYSLDANNGARKLMTELPMRGASFKLQRDGTPRYAVAWKNGLRHIFKFSDDRKEWLPLEGRQDVYPRVFSPDDKFLFANLSEEDGPSAFVKISVGTGETQVLARDPVASIGRVEWTARAAAPIATTTSVGIPKASYVDTSSREAQLHQALAAQFPGAYVSFQSFSDDGRMLLFSVESDREPGVYYLFDRTTGRAVELFAAMPAIDPARMGERRPVSFRSRDGLELHGYLTLPPKKAEKNLPLVLLPHGGPIGRSDTWFFDSDAQFLATRGYAVLQVNFRGSGGRGTAYQEKGLRRWGDAMPDDLIDGVRWAIAQGIADPARICAFGASYGAYASMMVSIRAPELFKCAAGYAGAYDLPTLLETREMRESRSARAALARSMGSDPAELARQSPTTLADKIKVPVLLVHGEEDTRTPPDQALAMRAALEKVGNPPEWLMVEKEGHGFYSEQNRINYLNKLEAFLAKHLKAR